MTLKKLLTLVASCIALLATMAATAGALYKSTLPDGSVVYSNVPVQGAATVKQMDSRTRDMGVQIATRAQAVAVENHRNNRRQRGQAQLVGTWQSDSIKDAYDPDEQFTLTFDLERKGDGFSGTVHELRPGDAPQLDHAIVDGAVDDDRITFYTKHDKDGEGKPVPYRTMYKGTIQGDRIAFTRYDDHPKGGLSERFLALRKKGE